MATSNGLNANRQRTPRALGNGQPDVFDINLSLIYDAMMRTTLTLDEDVAARVEELRRREGLSLKGAINLLLREGLRSHDQRPQGRRYRSRAHPLRMRAGYDPEKLNQLVDELTADEHRKRLSARVPARRS